MAFTWSKPENGLNGSVDYAYHNYMYERRAH